jgi:hypothetical protein
MHVRDIHGPSFVCDMAIMGRVQEEILPLHVPGLKPQERKLRAIQMENGC